MDKMKQEVKEKLTYWVKILVLFTLLMVSNLLSYFADGSDGENFYGFLRGFQIGIASTLTIFSAVNVLRFRKMLQDEEAVRNFYIKEHDERTAAIWEKSGGTVLYTCAVLMIGAGIVAGYFNPVVFITLIACGIFLLLVKKGLLLYYRRKM